MTVAIETPKLKVAVVGAGPGGLATVINLQRLPYIELKVFDQASELKEVGAGISINENTWRHLRLLGAADVLEQYTTRGDSTKIDGEQRNGRTGALLSRRYQQIDPEKPPRSRIERYKLQNALLSKVPKSLIQLSKKLSKITEKEDGILLTFTDGSEEGPFDLIVGADGIRSVVRQHAFPTHKLSYTGKVAYRTLIPQSAVSHIPGIPQASTFWHTRKTHVYTDPLDNGLFEIATRALVTEEKGEKVSWGQKVSKEEVVYHYKDYCETIKQIIDVPDEWLEFAIFGGLRLDSVIHGGHIALIGDASHPLSGAFGSGAAFAFEDAYVLAHALDYSIKSIHSSSDLRDKVSYALTLYDQVRSPHYKALYAILNGFADNAKEVESTLPLETDEDEDAYIEETTRRNWNASNAWIYSYDVTQVWADRVKLEDTQRKLVDLAVKEDSAVKKNTEFPQSTTISVAA